MIPLIASPELQLIILFALVTLACNLQDRPSEVINHLPTLTRTPLPTLTPTVVTIIAQSNNLSQSNNGTLLVTNETGVTSPPSNSNTSSGQVEAELAMVDNVDIPTVTENGVAVSVNTTPTNQFQNQLSTNQKRRTMSKLIKLQLIL